MAFAWNHLIIALCVDSALLNIQRAKWSSKPHFPKIKWRIESSFLCIWRAMRRMKQSVIQPHIFDVFFLTLAPANNIMCFVFSILHLCWRCLVSLKPPGLCFFCCFYVHSFFFSWKVKWKWPKRADARLAPIRSASGHRELEWWPELVPYSTTDAERMCGKTKPLGLSVIAAVREWPLHHVRLRRDERDRWERKVVVKCLKSVNSRFSWEAFYILMQFLLIGCRNSNVNLLEITNTEFKIIQ